MLTSSQEHVLSSRSLFRLSISRQQPNPPFLPVGYNLSWLCHKPGFDLRTRPRSTERRLPKTNHNGFAHELGSLSPPQHIDYVHKHAFSLVPSIDIVHGLFYLCGNGPLPEWSVLICFQFRSTRIHTGNDDWPGDSWCTSGGRSNNVCLVDATRGQIKS